MGFTRQLLRPITVDPLNFRIGAKTHSRRARFRTIGPAFDAIGYSRDDMRRLSDVDYRPIDDSATGIVYFLIRCLSRWRTRSRLLNNIWSVYRRNFNGYRGILRSLCAA